MAEKEESMLDKLVRKRDEWLLKRHNERMQDELKEAEEKKSIDEETRRKMDAIKERKKMLEGTE